MLAFIAVQVLVALAYSWSGLGGHLASLSALDLTGVIAALTVVFWPAATPRSAAPWYERARPLIPLAPFAFVLLRR